MNFGWTGMNDATAQMGVQFGKSAVAAGQDYVEKNVSVAQQPAWPTSPQLRRGGGRRRRLIR
jgi:hypothetical protein